MGIFAREDPSESAIRPCCRLGSTSLRVSADSFYDCGRDLIFGPCVWIISILEFKLVEVEDLNDTAFNTFRLILMDATNDEHLIRIGRHAAVT